MDAFVEDSGPADAKRKTPLQKHITRLTLFFEENALQERRELTRGVATVDQLETVYIISKTALDLERKPRLNYSGTTAGSVVGPIVVPLASEQWQLTFAQKKALFGPHRVAVGGRTFGAGADIGDSQRGKTHRNPDDMEPVFFHAKGNKIDEEILWMLDSKKKGVARIIDGSPGDGELAHLAVKKRWAYKGICLTADHSTQIEARIPMKVFEDFKTEGSGLHRPSLNTLLQTLEDEGNTHPPPPQAKSEGEGECQR